MDTRPGVLLGVALALVLLGGVLGWWGHTAGGSVAIEDVAIETEAGTIDGALYVPPEASPDDPAPGVVAVHGYINSKETQAPFAIELARRGHVVLAIDQPGHGYSDPPAFASGWGGPPALAYLSEHELVDEDRIALEGHSMGGWAVVTAAAEHPTDYESVVLTGSATGVAGSPAGTTEFPRNLAVVFAQYDEFHWLMWETPTAPATPESEKLQAVFGAEAPVEPGQQRGAIDAGTARVLHQPLTTHPGTHHSPTAIEQTVAWIEQTTGGGTDLEADDQRWYWKELGTAIAFFGGFLFVFPAVGILADRPRLHGAVRAIPPAVARRDRGWVVAVGLTAVVPVVTYYPALLLGSEAVPVTALTPQAETNGIVLWALLNTLVIGGLLSLWHIRSDRSLAAARAQYGLDSDGGGRTLGSSVALGGAVVAGVGVLLVFVDTAFGIDFRAWILALKLPSLLQLRIGLGYLPALLAFFLALGVLLHGRLRTPAATASLRRALLGNTALLAGPFLLLLVGQYAWLFVTGALPVPVTALQTVIAFQFVGVLSGVAAISTYCFHRTGRVWVGAVCNALLVTWLLAASQATHFPF